MSKCCYNNGMKFFDKPNAGICDICHPAENKMSPIEAVATCPPIGEPRLLTMMAPVVFDESGINLCRTLCLDDLQDVCQTDSRQRTDILFDGLNKRDLANACKIQLQVVDVDFNFLDPCDDYRFSDIVPAKGNPNLSRITLKDIDVTFSVEILDDCCKVVKEGMMTVRYLGDEEGPGYDSCTNPSCISFDLYTPYGISYAPENPYGCNKLVPTINYMGFVSSKQSVDIEKRDVCSYFAYPANNTIQQGVSAQALAKVVAYQDDCFCIGLTLYIKSIYFVQYKFRHEGLTVPPKLTPIEEDQNTECLDFVCGDLLEASIQPLDVGENPRTLNSTNGRNDRRNGDNGCCDGCVKCSCAKTPCSRAAASN